MKTEVTIPEEIQDVCRAIIKVAQQQGLRKFSGTFRPDYEKWSADVQFTWEQGRHGEDFNQLKITSTFWIHTEVKPKKP